MKKKEQFQLTFKLPIGIKKDEDVGYVSYCPPLDVWSQGKTKSEAEKNIKEALSLFFISCFERGTFSKVMEECGIEVMQTKARSKKEKVKSPRLKNINISIPFGSEQTPTPAAACHA